MSCHCWKCFHELKSTREEFCPACGIVAPYDGKRRVERLRRKSRLSKTWEAFLLRFAIGAFLLGFGAFFFGSLYWSGRRIYSYMVGNGSALFNINILYIVLLAMGGALLLGQVCLMTEKWMKRAEEEYAQAEADVEKIHPAFLKENLLLRSACEPTETLLRPAQGTTEPAPEQLLRTVDTE